MPTRPAAAWRRAGALAVLLATAGVAATGAALAARPAAKAVPPELPPETLTAVSSLERTVFCDHSAVPVSLLAAVCKPLSRLDSLP